MSRGKSWERAVLAALAGSAATLLDSRQPDVADGLVKRAHLIADAHERLKGEQDGKRNPVIDLRCSADRVVEVAGPLGLDGQHLSIWTPTGTAGCKVQGLSARGGGWVRTLLADEDARAELEQADALTLAEREVSPASAAAIVDIRDAALGMLRVQAVEPPQAVEREHEALPPWPQPGVDAKEACEYCGKRCEHRVSILVTVGDSDPGLIWICLDCDGDDSFSGEDIRARVAARKAAEVAHPAPIVDTSPAAELVRVKLELDVARSAARADAEQWGILKAENIRLSKLVGGYESALRIKPAEDEDGPAIARHIVDGLRSDRTEAAQDRDAAIERAQVAEASRDLAQVACMGGLKNIEAIEKAHAEERASLDYVLAQASAAWKEAGCEPIMHVDELGVVFHALLAGRRENLGALATMKQENTSLLAEQSQITDAVAPVREVGETVLGAVQRVVRELQAALRREGAWANEPLDDLNAATCEADEPGGHLIVVCAARAIRRLLAERTTAEVAAQERFKLLDDLLAELPRVEGVSRLHALKRLVSSARMAHEAIGEVARRVEPRPLAGYLIDDELRPISRSANAALACLAWIVEGTPAPIAAMPAPINVVSAVIVRDGKLLLAQRAPGDSFAGRWETAGGKVEPGEAWLATVIRELHKELGIEAINVRRWLNQPTFTLDPPVVSHPLRMTFYQVDIGAQEPRPLASSELRWCSREEVLALPMTPGTEAARAELAKLCKPAQLAPEPSRSPTPRLTWTACGTFGQRRPDWEAYAGSYALSVERFGEADYRDTDGNGTAYPTLEAAKIAAEDAKRESLIEGLESDTIALAALNSVTIDVPAQITPDAVRALGGEVAREETATCNSCGGNGRIRESQDDGVRRNSDGWRKCLDCNGTGHDLDVVTSEPCRSEAPADPALDSNTRAASASCCCSDLLPAERPCVPCLARAGKLDAGEVAREEPHAVVDCNNCEGRGEMIDPANPGRPCPICDGHGKLCADCSAPSSGGLHECEAEAVTSATSAGSSRNQRCQRCNLPIDIADDEYTVEGGVYTCESCMEKLNPGLVAMVREHETASPWPQPGVAVREGAWEKLYRASVAYRENSFTKEWNAFEAARKELLAVAPDAITLWPMLAAETINNDAPPKVETQDEHPFEAAISAEHEAANAICAKQGHAYSVQRDYWEPRDADDVCDRCGAMAPPAPSREDVIDGAIRACLTDGPHAWRTVEREVVEAMLAAGHEGTNVDEVNGGLGRVGARWEGNPRFLLTLAPAEADAIIEPTRGAVAEHEARAAAMAALPVNSIGTCKLCGYHGPGPRHDCKAAAHATPEPS